MVGKRGEATLTKKDLNVAIMGLAKHFDGKFASLDAKIDGVDAKIGGVDAKIGGVDAKFDAKFAALDAKIDSVDAKFEAKTDKIQADIGHMKADIKRLMIASVDTNEHVTSIESRLTQQMRDLRSDLNGRFDSMISKMETMWRESQTFPKILDEHGMTLRAHDVRLRDLEARYRSP